MREFKGKVAFVTGGASGIGFAMARAFLDAGMRVMMADVEKAALDRALAELGPRDGAVRGLVLNVADAAAVEQAAAETVSVFGAVHVLCNNAGVAAGGLQEQVAQADWNWVLDVNLLGVVHGIRAFLPRLKAQGQGGHIVNTASMAGLHSFPGLGPYCVSKFAVVALSEGLSAELMGSGIGVSVLCPGWVRTKISDSGRNRPGGAATLPQGPGVAAAEGFAALVRSGMDPAQVASAVLEAIRAEDLYILTHPEMRGPVEERFKRIREAFDKAAARVGAAS